MDDEYVETSDPEEIGYFHVWRKKGNGERVLDAIRAPLGNSSKRVRLSSERDVALSSSLQANLQNDSDNSDASQDPLLMQAASPPPETDAVWQTDPLTPTTSIFSSSRLSFSSQSPMNSQDPLRMSPRKPIHPSLDPEPLDDNTMEEDGYVPESPVPALRSLSEGQQPIEDDLMAFSPIAPLSLLPSVSSPENHLPVDSSDHPPPPEMEINTSWTSSPEIQTAQMGPEDAPVPMEDEALIIPPDPDEPRARYSLRERTNQQRQPYLYDKALYRAQLRDVPDAIVTLKSPSRRERHRGPEDQYEEELQDRGYEASDNGGDEEEDAPRRRRSKSRSQDPTNGAIPPLSESDDETRKKSAAYRQEWRKLEKKRRNESAQDTAESKKGRREKTRKAHPLPVSRGSSSERDNSLLSSSIRPGRRSATPLPRRTPSPMAHGHLSDSPAPPLNFNDPGVSSPSPSPYRAAPRLSKPPSSFPRSPSPNSSRHSHSPIPQLPSSFDRNTYETPIVIEDDFINPAPVPVSTEGSNMSESEDDQSMLQKRPRVANKKLNKRLKLLKMMYPTFMIPHLDRESENSRKQQRRGTSPPPETEPAPGHARKKLNKGGPLKEVKGDTESSDDAADNIATPSQSASPMRAIPASPPPGSLLDFSSSSRSSSPYRIRRRVDNQIPAQDVIEISDDSDSHDSDSPSSSSGIDDDVISCYVRGVTPDTGTQSRIPRDEKLIDYMLGTNVAIGRRRRRRPVREKRANGQASGSGRTARGSGHGEAGGSGRARVLSSSSRHNSKHSVDQGYKQTHLSFENHRTRPAGKHATSRRSPVSARTDPARASSPESSDRSPSPERGRRHSKAPPQPIELTEADKQKKSKKQREKERKKKAITHGIHFFAGEGVRVTTGRRTEGFTFEGGNEEVYDYRARKGRSRRKRRKNNFRLDDFDNEDLRNAILPPVSASNNSQQRGASALQRAYQQAGDAEDALAFKSSDPTSEAEDEPGQLQPDNTHRLRSGVTFGPSTYIGKGLLFQLLDRATPPPDSSFSRLGFTLNSQTTLVELQDMLPNICSGALEIFGDLPDDDDLIRMRDWVYLLHGVCWAISLHLSNDQADAVGLNTLKTIVLKQTDDIVHRLEGVAIGLPALNYHWYALEMLLRANYEPTSVQVTKAASLLAKHLFAFSIPMTLKYVRDSTFLDNSSSLTQRAAELWVCLIHAIPQELFWKVVEGAFGDSKAQGEGLLASEQMWNGIFGLCALSQFTARGATTSNPHLSANWSVVCLALKQVCLQAGDWDMGRSEDTLRQRDMYARMVVTRCFLLTSTWKWKVEGKGDTQMLEFLKQILGSRSFANLYGEKAEYPDFLKTLNWDLCWRYRKEDTAFVMFLKLVVQALGSSNPPEVPKTSRTKKICSMVVPQSPVNLAHGQPPTSTEISKLCNRIAAISLIIYFDSGQLGLRLAHARKYVAFEKVEINTRTVFIRALMRLSVLMVHSGIDMSGTFDWFGDIGEVLRAELISKHADAKAYNSTVLQVGLLLRTLCYIIVTYKEVRKYPDPGFFVKLRGLFKLICSTKHSTPAISYELMRLTRTFFDAREAVVPPPERPAIAEAELESEESQETQYDLDDLDMNHPDLLDALSGDKSKAPPPPPCEDFRLKDARIAPELEPLRWQFFRSFKACLNGIKTTRERTGQLVLHAQQYLETWYRCIDLFSSGDRKAKGWLQELNKVKNEIQVELQDSGQRRRIEIYLMHIVLKVCPMAYKESPDLFLELLPLALIPVSTSSELTVEHEFISLLLSIDGARHPVLQKLPFARARSADDYKISIPDLQDARLEALRCKHSQNSLKSL
ncbi:hypothetical protein PQX77_021910 [Marasmius sp. AFHP31]|nr:hypothetical protein PQX77_021910 [Marasmius sp. AFHP31]